MNYIFKVTFPRPDWVKWTISVSNNDNDIILLLLVNKQVCWIKTPASMTPLQWQQESHVPIETEEVFLHMRRLYNYFKREEKQITLQRGFTYD